MDYKDILTKYGFYCWHSCKCGGTRTENYRTNPPTALEFKVKPKYKLIETKVNKKITCRTDISNLESEILKYRTV